MYLHSTQQGLNEFTWSGYLSLHPKYLLFLSGVNKTWIFSTYLVTSHNIKFYENLCCGNRVVLCGRTDRETDKKKTGMTKVTTAFGNFAKRSYKLNQYNRLQGWASNPHDLPNDTRRWAEWQQQQQAKWSAESWRAVIKNLCENRVTMGRAAVDSL